MITTSPIDSIGVLYRSKKQANNESASGVAECVHGEQPTSECQVDNLLNDELTGAELLGDIIPRTLSSLGYGPEDPQ